MTQFQILWGQCAPVLMRAGFGWVQAARFFGGFLLIMAIVYGCLIFTGWLGKKFGGH